MTDNSLPIRLIVFDIDGVISDGEARPLDLRLLEQLGHMNRLARQDPSRPAVTLCTGRPASYVEVVLQAIDGQLPGIFENGVGLYVPEGYQFFPHPEVGNGTGFKAAYERLEKGLVKTGRAYFQPGKEYSLSIFTYDPAETPRLYEWAVEALGSLQKTVELSYAASCLNVLPSGIDKGKGLEFLASRTGYTFDEMLGVGDSDVDLPFLALTGYSAAPANANEAVKQTVQYVSPYETVDGVRDILKHFEVA